MGKKLTKWDFDQVESWIGTGPKTFNLLYSITGHGCGARVFHQKCDKQGSTLTVLYSKEGSVYGGYNRVSWQSVHFALNQRDDAAFLYQLYFTGNKISKKFPLKSGMTAICSSADLGPTFGGWLFSNLNAFNGEIQKPSSGEYNLNGKMSTGFGTNYETRGTASNEVNNGHMRVTELVVYAVKGSGICNLVASVFRGRISHRARVGGNPQTSTTTQLTPYTFGDKASIQLYDTRGIAETDTLDLLQCNFILDGHVPDFYEMSPSHLLKCDDAEFRQQAALKNKFHCAVFVLDGLTMASTSLISNDDADFQHRPKLSNKTHCVVFVLDGSTVDDISTPMLHKLKTYRNLLNRKEIPQAVLVTKIDKLCDKTDANVSSTFLSQTVKEVVEKVSELFKIPRNNIWPIKNYEEEVESDENINILALLAVRQILFFAEDYLENMNVKQKKHFDQVESWIGTGPKTFNLLYSITRDGCDPSMFHQKCDNQGPTLTVLYNKEGSVYGGYASVKWISSPNGLDQNDNSAFLYQLYFSGLNTPNKYSVKNGHTAICSSSNLGPLFGSNTAYDVHTFSSIIQKSSSGEYNLNGDVQFHFGKNYDTAGISSKEFNNGHIRVTELEVLGSLKEEVKGIQPSEGLDVPHFNILLLGPLGSGKSSICNLVASVFRGRISHRARVGIPQAALITKIDKLCEQSAENTSNTFLSPAVKELVCHVADLLNLPRNSILPVKNYEEEMESDENINILALLAVRQILFFAEDYLENMKDKQSRSRGNTNSGQALSDVRGSDTA
ncbi:IFI44-like protein [Mya arenaria]|uniref:IFI44-like protein n=1 Tax=Mya arenaria TaxID=6604 RepID=A0ABY7DDG9_MYAAR|nr:IFI44-like protein [Mya arenaria]